MATMTLSNYTGSADTYTWNNNPNVFDDALDTNYVFTNIPYNRRHFLVSGGGIPPKTLVLTGHFHGASKKTYYRDLAKHVSENYLLKKLYWESDKFYLCVGKAIKQTNSGTRINFIDYVCSFETIVGILFGHTPKTSGTNDGNVTTYIQEISGTVTNGAADIVITDAFGNEVTVPAASLTTDHTFSLKFVKMVDSGGCIYLSEYNYCEVNSVQIKTLKVSGGSGILQLAAAANITTVVTTNITSAVKKFRDGWVS